MTRQQKRLPLGIVVTLEALASALAWRDLTRRPEAQVPGRKRAWRVFITLNPGNSLFYWLLGPA